MASNIKFEEWNSYGLLVNDDENQVVPKQAGGIQLILNAKRQKVE